MVNINAKTAKLSALQIAYVAVCAATVTAGKMALAAIPNVEIVSLLLAAYGYCFGLSGVLASFVFCGVEILIWGAGGWVVLYFIYWPALTLLFAVFGRLKVKNRIVITLTACVMTTLFGVLSSLIDTGLFTGFHENFWSRFAIIYVRGASFYITQIVCNAITFTLLFAPFTALLRKITPAKLLHINRRKTVCRGKKTAAEKPTNIDCEII